MHINMGLCLGSEVTEEGKKAKINSEKIDRELYEYAKQELNVVKILMLGAAESGKSTLVKQMKIIHSHGFTKQELISFKPAVLDNLLTSMKFVLHGMGVLRINLANNKNKVHAHSLLSCGRCFDEERMLFPFVAHALRCLWADLGVRVAAARGYEYELNDSALYFFDNMNRIISPEYVPTETDVLRVRLRTTGIIETQFKVNRLVFRMYDVGGQRTERRKWIGCFEEVRAVLFVVALSGYDMTLIEDPAMVIASLQAGRFGDQSGCITRVYNWPHVSETLDQVFTSSRHYKQECVSSKEIQNCAVWVVAKPAEDAAEAGRPCFGMRHSYPD
ncbi:guanine nucleotide-binding protein G(o) subunit alpha-like [Polyodon spathula]|uniref:guanine nucleotide-binding protein G(o) subunit alpha-like n=1 Tax=Polyodon spathula TaxID=7913 RepID=UPI001B7F4C86|nr:guanine nucleotide-binding protein G(o) subunit alpha-like [Polyodon spathula]